MKILVVRNDKLGDFITALPALYILKQHLPRAHIAVLIAPLNESVALSCDFIDEVIIDEGQKAKALGEFLRSKHFDLSFTLFSNTRVAVAQFLARIPVRVAPATKIAQIFYTKRIRQHRSEVKMAEFEYNMQLIRSYFKEIKLSYPQPLLSFDASLQKARYQSFCDSLEISGDTVAFHCGFGGSSDANWSVAQYIELAQSIQDRKVNCVFTFGPGDEPFFDAFEKLGGQKVFKVYHSEGSVADFALLIASFKLFVSTSTGTFHIASAVGTPTMTFFADTLFASAKRWKSIGAESLQHNYMIPQDADAKRALFEKVKKDLSALIS